MLKYMSIFYKNKVVVVIGFGFGMGKEIVI